MIETCVIIVIMLVKYDKCLCRNVLLNCVCAVADLGVFATLNFQVY